MPKGECQGEWAKTIHEETRRHTVSILGYEVGSYEYEHTETRIKYEVTCGIVYELKVKGSGSVEREVGIEYRYEGQNSINGVSRPVSRERTDPRRCTYFLGGCSFDLEKSFGKAYVDSRQNVKKKPVTVTEICVDGSKLPKGIVAYNRPKWFGDPPGTIPGVEDESKVHSSPEDPCVEDIPIDWDKVPSSDLSIEGLAVSR